MYSNIIYTIVLSLLYSEKIEVFFIFLFILSLSLGIFPNGSKIYKDINSQEPENNIQPFELTKSRASLCKNRKSLVRQEHNTYIKDPRRSYRLYLKKLILPPS